MGLFGKFKKKDNHKTERFPNSRIENIFTFSMDWFYYFQERTGDFSYSIIYDGALDHLSSAMRKKYPHTLEVSVPYLDNTENGWPDNEEYERLNEIEENLYSNEEMGDMVTYIARIIDANNSSSRFIFCYSNLEEEDEIKMLASMVMGGLDVATYSYRAIPNDNSTYFSENIAPNFYEQQQIKNLSVYQQLQAHGEVFKTVREVDFLFVFHSDTHVEEIKNTLIEEGFCEVRCEKMADETYCLEVVLEIIPELNDMHKWTNWFLQLLENTDGYFDGWGCPVHRN